MKQKPARHGIGYDAHQFGSRRKLVLGGVHVPHIVGLEGHSDADVLLHAICDSLLGAAALGDIGKHFPDRKKRYKDISSLILLGKVGDLLRRKGYCVWNVDSMVLLERPKIQPYVATMRKRIARVLRVPVKSISIKATTNEGMGFIGRGEGCAALAVATIIPAE